MYLKNNLFKYKTSQLITICSFTNDDRCDGKNQVCCEENFNHKFLSSLLKFYSTNFLKINVDLVLHTHTHTHTHPNTHTHTFQKGGDTIYQASILRKILKLFHKYFIDIASKESQLYVTMHFNCILQKHFNLTFVVSNKMQFFVVIN